MTFPPIEEILPHRSPLLLLEEVLSWEGERIECSATLPPGAPFVHGDYAAGIVMLEHMAQGAAAFAGMLARERGEKIRIGFLVAVREMDLTRDRVRVGSRLLVDAVRVWGDAKLGHFRCSVREHDRVCARAALSVVREDVGGEG